MSPLDFLRNKRLGLIKNIDTYIIGIKLRSNNDKFSKDSIALCASFLAEIEEVFVHQNEIEVFIQPETFCVEKISRIVQGRLCIKMKKKLLFFMS